MNTPFKMKGFSGFGNSPAKHTKSRGNHMKRYGKDHTNEDHPNYWKEPKEGMSHKTFEGIEDVGMKERKKRLDSLEKVQKSASDKKNK